MNFRTITEDTPELVSSVIKGYFYPCPDLKTLDQHLIMLLTEFVGPRSNCTPERKAKARADIDKLLERRAWLQIAESPAA